MTFFKTPSFWYDTTTAQSRLAARCLLPFSILYNAGRILRQSVNPQPYKSPIPVICIGNLTAGGSGKTPAALALMDLIRTEKIAKNPVFLTRGYGGTVKTPTLVAAAQHTATMVGDEALLLARLAPTIVSANRPAGTKFAERNGFDLIVMDDGFQNPSLAKTLSLAVIDGKSGFGNGSLLPAGPLREPLQEGLVRADGFILIGDDHRYLRALLPAEKPVFEAKIEVSRHWIADTKSSYIAFCGLGRPEKFKETLESQKIRIAAWHPFPDHHRYTKKDISALLAAAEQQKARLITTEKDSFRLPIGFSDRHQLDILPIDLIFCHPETLSAFIGQTIHAC